MNAAELDRACDARYEGNFLQAQDLMQQPNGVEVVIDAVIREQNSCALQGDGKIRLRIDRRLLGR